MVKKVSTVRNAAGKTGRQTPKAVKRVKAVKPSAATKGTKPNRTRTKQVARRQEPLTLEQQLAQREAELAILNSVGEAMSKTLDVKTVTRIVGDKVRDIFNSEAVDLLLLDGNTNLIHGVYSYYGEYQQFEPFRLGQGLTSRIITTRQPMILGTNQQQHEFGSISISEEDKTESYMGVPIIAGDEVLGVVSVQSYQQNAYSENHVSLLQTLAANMGVAIQNARLFEAGQERVAELQILNSIQQGLAAELDFQALVDLVGDKLREIFHKTDMYIRIYDPKTGLEHLPYTYQNGERISIDSEPLGETGFGPYVIRTRETLVINENMAQAFEKIGSHIFPGTQMEKSSVFVPLIVGDQARGLINLMDMEREHAFSESDVRLLQMLANSMSVALENARLYQVANRRAQEVATMAEISREISASLDLSTVLERIAQRAKDSLRARDVVLRLLGPNGRLSAEVAIGKYAGIYKNWDAQLGRGLSGSVAKTGVAEIINDPENDPRVIDIAGTEEDKATRAILFAPLFSGDSVIGVLSVWRDKIAVGPFTQADLDFAVGLARQAAIAIQNARLFETERVAREHAETLQAVTQALSRTLSLQEVFDLILSELQKVVPYDSCSVQQLDGEYSVIVGGRGFPNLDELLGMRFLTTAPGDLSSFVIETRQPHIEEDVSARFAHFKDIQEAAGLIHGWLGVPLIFGDRVIGMLALDKHEKAFYTPEHAQLAMAFAAQAAVAIENARLLETERGAREQAESHAIENARLFEETQRLFKAEQERVAELQIINSIQQGLAAELDFQAIIDLVGDKLREVLNTPDLGIRWYDEKNNLLHYAYSYEHNKRIYYEPSPPTSGGIFEAIVKSRQPEVFNSPADRAKLNVPLLGTEVAISSAYFPIISSDRVLGLINSENYERENAFGESELRLLTTIAASLGTALENARLFDETQRLFKAEQERVAELQIINSIQQGLAAELDFQAIVDLVGDKLREVFNTPDLMITWYNEKDNLVNYLYMYEHGKRIVTPSRPPNPGGIYETEMKTRQPLVFNNPADFEKLNSSLIPGTDQSKSSVSVPIISSDRFLGDISMDNYERESAYGESELRLLTTIAASLGTALENARLFDETQRLFKAEQERVAELQIINSIQQGLAAELDFQAIVDLVGDKLREVFRTPDLGINWYDEKTNLLHVLYAYEHGKRMTIEPYAPAPGGVFETQAKIRQPIVLNSIAEMEKMGALAIPGTDQSKSTISVPVISSDRVIGNIGLENYEREYAYGESELRLLTTIAASLGTALENARLFDETQRLLKETEERNAELAVINSVQQGLASKLEMQAIYDLVAMQLAKSLQAPVVDIIQYNRPGAFYDYLSVVMNGKRVTEITRRIELTPEAVQLIETMSKAQDEPFVLREGVVSLVQGMGYGIIKGMETLEACVALPVLSTEDEVTFIILLTTKDAPFDQNTSRLFKMIANATALTLENARLFDETQRLLKITEDRAAELAIINSVQAALAAELNIQGIYDAVGDKIREIFHNTDMSIRIYDPQTNLVHYPYIYEKGERLTVEASQLGNAGFEAHVIRTRQTVVINENMPTEVERYGAYLVPGTQQAKSSIFVPLAVGDQSRGMINLDNYDHEHAFSESDVRLLQTLANSMSVALENARLFDETQRLLKITEDRAAELAIINSVQAALAAELNIQGIYDAVGDKIREIFHNSDMHIRIHDPQTNLMHFAYVYENGQRIDIESIPLPDNGFSAHVLRTRETIVINENMAEEEKKYGSYTIPGTGESKSELFVPLVVGDQARGLINLIDMEREHAFSESDVRLLQTLANSMSVALENARLFDETQRLLKITEDRAAELAIINSVQEGLASKLDMQAIYDLVGDKLAEVMNTLDIDIRLFLSETQQVLYPYLRDQGKRMEIPPQPLRGFSKHVFETRQTVIINEKMAERMAELGSELVPGTQMEKSYIAVPIMVGGRALGMVSTSNYEKENAFGESEVRLLQTVVSAMSVALENARLFDETQRLLKETEQRAAELAIINSVQEGLASKLEMQAIYDLVGDKIRDIFDAQTVILVTYEPATKLMSFPYVFEKGNRLAQESLPLDGKGIMDHVILKRQPIMINSDMIRRSAEITGAPAFIIGEGGEPVKSRLDVPMIVGNEARGVISLQNVDRENAFTESDLRLLQTLANSMSVALENARLFNAEQQRAAELAVINSIQQGLAAELDFQTIIDLVGDKLREVLNTGEIGIRWYDAEANLIHYLYEYEHNERITIASATPSNKIWESLVLTRKPIILNTAAEGFALGVTAVPGTDQSKSAVYIPIVGSDRVLGIIVTEDYENENAFTEADIRLLSTVASSMGVALENARLFNETQQRNAELAIINSVQQGLASKLEFQSIIDLIGEKIAEIFNAQATLISLYNPEKAEIDHKYLIERGERIYFNRPVSIDRFRQRVVDTRQPWLINQNYKQIAEEMGEEPVLEGEEPKSLLFVPMIVGSGVTGVISLQNLDVENAFSESDVRLLSTIASSMSVALENARLFEAEQQRVAELAIINSVQQGLASKLDMQAIYDLVGNKIGEIFNLHTCYIMLYDREKGIEHYPFLVDNGKRVVQEDLPHDENGFGPLVMKTLQPIMINEDMEGRSREVGSYNITDDGDEVKSAIYVPLMIGSEARGVISVQNAQRENAFRDSDLRLLTTLASSMSVALESARLFVETEQRAAELATINSIQEGLASKLEPQAIYDLVGEKLREVFGAQFLYIAIHDRETNLIHFPYFWERDHREITEEPIRYGEGLTSHVIETRQPLVINTDWLQRATELGGVFLEGENPKSSISVPIMSGNTAIGVISLQSTVAENQYSESEVRLLSTITSSVGVALESARLFHETEQRAAELAIINEVQEGLASKLEVQAIYELVGEKLRELFGKMAISLVTFDLKKDIHHYEYIVEKGQRLAVEDSPITLTGRHLIRTRQTLLVNDHIVENLAKIGITMQIIPGTETPQSMLRVPILIGDRVHGFIGLSDLDRENAFSASDVRLLQTLAGSLSVALENARLFEETNRNAAELATVNTVSSALASELDVDPLIQLVGEQARAIFMADIVYVALLDDTGKTINFPYTYGEDLPPMDYGEGVTSKIIQTGKPLLLNQDVDKQIAELGATSVGVSSQSYLGVPIFVGGRAVGVLSVQSLSTQGVFDENSQRLLTTIASNVGSALQNARLYREAQESRAAAEQANKAKSAFLANMSHELRTPLNAIIGFTRIVRRKAEGALPEKQTDNLDKVLSSAEHLLSLINTVLDIAKIEAGRMEVQASNFNISALADQCANTAAPLLKPGVRLEKEIDPALAIVHSDQDKIKQIILNLLSNAAKFTHEGSIVLRMRRVEPYLLVDVVDSGIGISEEALGRIFEEFQQADTSTTRQYGGTGLGLSISRNLARLLGGDLTATSVGLPGKGSTFTLTIPMQYGYRSASATKPEPESTPQVSHLLKADASKKLILVIDDDPDAVYLLQENLSPEEFEVVGTRNGLEGQQLARDLQPQAILLDIIMPDKDGWQVLHDLKADEQTKDIPVILLTIVDKKALGFQLGASAYLLKPLDPAAVQEALKRVTVHDGNGHVHVLVVDDDPHVADMLRQSLPESTFKLDSAEDGVAGLQAIEAHRPDVVLLDIMMPRLDGFGVIEHLRASEATRDLPIIVISAKELTDEEMKTLEERVNFVMKKQGFDGEKLMEEINSVLTHPS